MPSLLDNPDATGDTQDLDMSGSQGSIKRDGSRGGEEPRRQFRRTASRTKQQREGGASGSTTVVSKPTGEGKVVEQRSLNKIMLKAILKTHQTLRDLSSTVWDTLLIKASSLEADNMQKQTQTYAEKVRQDGKGHSRGPPFVWAYLGLVKTLQQRGNAVGARTAQGLATYWARLEPLSPMQICDEVRFCRLEKTYKADIKRVTAGHCIPGEAAPRSRGTQPNRVIAQVRTGPTDSHGKSAAIVPGRSSEDVKIIVGSFLAEKGVLANSKAWRNAMQSEHVKRMAIAQEEGQ